MKSNGETHKNKCFRVRKTIFKDTVVHRAFPSLHGVSLKIPLTVPFMF